MSYLANEGSGSDFGSSSAGDPDGTDLDRALAQMKENLDRLIHEADEAISESEAASALANQLLNA